MNFIEQEIISKKLLLIYYIENLRDEFAKINREVNFLSLEENVDNIKNGLTKKNYLQERIKVTIKNIGYLIENEILDVKYLQEQKKIMNIFWEKFDDYEEDLIKVIAESENDLNNILSTEIFLKKYKEKYMLLISEYERYLYNEKELVTKIVDIWNKELTNCKTYTKGCNYKFLVYATRLKAENVIDIVLNKNALIYTSYITIDHAKTYQNRGYGLIFEPKDENILFMSDSDNMTVDFEIMLDGYNFSLNNSYFFRGNGIVGVSHTNLDVGRTYTPEQLLGESYNEVVLINNEYTIPKAVFIFEDAKDFEKKEASKLANLLNLDLLELERVRK